MHPQSKCRIGAGAVAALSLALMGSGPAGVDLTSLPDSEPAIVAASAGGMGLAPLPVEAVSRKLAAFTASLWPMAERRGVDRGTFDRALGAIAPDPEVVAFLDSQPEHVSPPWDYLARLVSEARIEMGKAKLAELRPVLDAVEARFGVDRHIVLAVWGVESGFGASLGGRPVVRSLATLAVVDQRRPQFWRNELLAALVILARGDIDGRLLMGSWAGAMGHTQFMPSSYLAHAVDMDADGRRDIWTSTADALGSTASFLRSAGWRPGQSWGGEVVLPAGFDMALAGAGVMKPVAEWRGAGVEVSGGHGWPQTGEAMLLLPAGARGPAFLAGGNFRAILKYNNSVLYALAVSHLADRIAGRPAIAAAWPTDDPPLGRAGSTELQRRLGALGYDVGAFDGIVGDQTRSAIRAWQQAQALSADGYPSEQLLDRLRRSGGR